MKVRAKIEDLVFGSKALSHVEILKDKWVIVKRRCTIEKLSDTECMLLLSTGDRYGIYGEGLQVKEYGDTYVKITSRTLSRVTIEKSRHLPGN